MIKTYVFSGELREVDADIWKDYPRSLEFLNFELITIISFDELVRYGSVESAIASLLASDDILCPDFFDEIMIQYDNNVAVSKATKIYECTIGDTVIPVGLKEVSITEESNPSGPYARLGGHLHRIWKILPDDHYAFTTSVLSVSHCDAGAES